MITTYADARPKPRPEFRFLPCGDPTRGREKKKTTFLREQTVNKIVEWDLYFLILLSRFLPSLEKITSFLRHEAWEKLLFSWLSSQRKVVFFSSIFWLREKSLLKVQKISTCFYWKTSRKGLQTYKIMTIIHWFRWQFCFFEIAPSSNKRGH